VEEKVQAGRQPRQPPMVRGAQGTLSKQHNGLGPDLLANQRKLVQWLPCRQHPDHPIVAAQEQAGDQQLQLMTQLRHCNHHHTLCGLCRLHLQPVLYPCAQEPVQHQPFTGTAELIPPPEQLLPQRQKNILENGFCRVTGINLPVQAFQLGLVECTQRSPCTALPFTVLIGDRLRALMCRVVGQ